MKELQEMVELLEARKPGLTYVEKQVKNVLERVTAMLQGNDSGVFTKLAGRYDRLDKAIKKMGEKKNELNDQLKQKVEELFAAEDVVLTRVVETASFTITLSKQAKKEDPKKVVDYESIAKELLKLIPEELEAQVKEITEAYTKLVPVPPKSPGIRVSSKLDEGVANAMRSMLSKIRALMRGVLSWAKKFDKRLGALKTQAGMA